MSACRGASPPVIAVTGLALEARVAAGSGVCALPGAGRAPGLGAALERALQRGAAAVISFGIAGGLAEDLGCGTWIVARAVVTPVGRWPCDAAWVRILAERLPGARTADVAGVDEPVAEPAAKRALHRATGAAAVDTESHIAVRIAAAYGLPFAAFRVVADSALRTLPPLTRAALAPDGSIRAAAVLGALLRRPAQLPSLLRTAIDAGTALRALSRGRRLLGHGLGYPDRGELLFDVS